MAGSAEALTRDAEAGAGFQAAPDVQAAVGQWLAWLRDERRVADNTVEAYGRDVRQFLRFLSRHHGEAPRLTIYFGAMLFRDRYGLHGIDPTRTWPSPI